jgi:peptide/nickel transport system permease protein
MLSRDAVQKRVGPVLVSASTQPSRALGFGMRGTGRSAGRSFQTRRFGARPLSPSLIIGATIIGVLVFTAAAAALLAPFDPKQIGVGQPLQAPAWPHLFGTDAFGRDVFSRVLYGAQLALCISTGGVTIAATLGVTLGLLAGYYGGRLDHLLSRMVEVWMAFPGLLLALIIVARLGPSLTNTLLALGIVGVPSYYRLVRALTISTRHQAYVESAQATGLTDRRILLGHVLPNALPAIIVLASMRMGMLLLAGGGLSFIGLGAQPPLPEWGAMLASGRDYLQIAPWLAIFPGLSLTITSIGFNLLGDGLRDALDPLQRRD